MDTEKKSSKQIAEEPKKDIGEIVGDLVVSGATVLHTAAEAVVKRVTKAAAKTALVKAITKVGKKAKKSLRVSKVAKSKKSQN